MGVKLTFIAWFMLLSGAAISQNAPDSLYLRHYKRELRLKDSLANAIESKVSDLNPALLCDSLRRRHPLPAYRAPALPRSHRHRVREY